MLSITTVMEEGKNCLQEEPVMEEGKNCLQWPVE